MVGQNATISKWDDARALLGVSPDAADSEVRRAYLEKVRQHPPDRDPEHFERVRDAYQLLRDPRQRAKQVLEGPDPGAPLTSLLGTNSLPRRFAGTAAWVAVLKEKRS